MERAARGHAQIDFSGEWSPNGGEDSGGDPMVGNCLGLPLNDAALLRAETWEASIQSVPEWQCRPHGWVYIARGPTSMRIWKDEDEAGPVESGIMGPRAGAALA